MPILARQLLPAVPGSSPSTHVSGIAFSVTLKDFNRRRLACPIGPEHREYLAMADVEIQIPHRV